MFIDSKRKKKQASAFPSEIYMDLDVRNAFFFSSNLEFLVLKDLTVDLLKNAFGEHVLKEEIHEHRKLSYPYLQSSSVIKPFCLQYQHNSAV